MKFPSSLQSGDKIAIVAPAGKLGPGALDKSVEVLTEWRLEVVLGPHVYDHHNYFAGNDFDRLADLQWALDDESIKAILFARGGYGTTRILDLVDFSKVLKSPKWLIGFSDITALHLKLESLGVASIHGPMGTSFPQPVAEESLTALRELLFNNNSVLTSATKAFRSGLATAPVTGGNLSLLVDSLGTSNAINTQGKILYIEEVGEKTYRIDRMLWQLRRAGKLTDLAGLVLGHFSLIEDGDTPFGEPWQDVIKNIVAPYAYPVAFGFNIGHEPENFPVVNGAVYQFEAGETGASLSLKLPD